MRKGALRVATIDSYENLANAIVLKAVEDYRLAWKKIKHLPEEKRKCMCERLRKENAERKTVEYMLKKKKLRTKRTSQGKAVLTFYECENFFRSRWFGVLTALDGEELIRKLQEEANT